MDRAGQEDEASGQQAQPDKPSEGSVFGTSHRPFISGMRISVEPGRTRLDRESPRKVSSAPRRCARVGAGRSAEDRLLCKQEVLGSNPSRSTAIRLFECRQESSTVQTCSSSKLGGQQVI